MPRRKRTVRHDFFDDDLDADDTNSQSSKNGYPPEQRNAANLRERARMRVLSGAFGRLKTKLPNIPPDTKLSKLDTLRLAIIYIKQLKGALDVGGVALGCTFEANSYLSTITQSESSLVTNTHNDPSVAVPSTMSWPFGFHQNQYMDQEAAATSTSSSSSNNNNSFINNNINNVELFAKYAFTEQTCAHNQNFYQLETHRSSHNNEQQQQYQQQQLHHHQQPQQQQQLNHHHHQRTYYRHRSD